jgi:hypothetical protein
MKFIFSTIIIFLLIYNQNIVYKNKQNTVLIPQVVTTTLDSLQGNWKSLVDSTLTLSIEGRYYIEKTNDSLEINEKIYLTYFSDTLVDEFHQFTFDQVVIDTTKKSGKFLVNISTDDNTIECFTFNGFSSRPEGLVFSIKDVWAKRKNANFLKVP